MRTLKRLSVLFLALVMTVSLPVSACAVQEQVGSAAASLGNALISAPAAGFSDVADDAWYAGAVDYVHENGLMNGLTATTFGPNTTMSRAMLATVLYGAAGRPSVDQGSTFPDVAPGDWYADPVSWASASGVMSGYDDGRFGTHDPVTREQIAAILWRYEGSPAAETGTVFADQSAISSWAATAVAWARSQGIVSGREGNRFDPAGHATRAEVAIMLMNYLDESQPAPQPTPETGAQVLVAYFSATGNTRQVAQQLDAVLGGDLYEIVPQVPYTSADLNYSNSSSRSQVELRDAAARPAISGGVDDMAGYDVIFLGYPIWNGQAPKIISTFLESYDLAGKTIVPFCTSGSSSIGSSAANLHSLAPDATWLDGQRFSSSASQSTVEAWVDGLGLTLDPQEEMQQEATAMEMTVEYNGHTITFALNDSQAARDLYDQLPLTVELENFSNNEKIFYPPDGLDTTGAPQASGGAGTLAYYAPWGDVALFYGSFNGNSSLYGLGQATQGAEFISSLSGTVTFQRGGQG